jgi:hypothetical protein
MIRPYTRPFMCTTFRLSSISCDVKPSISSRMLNDKHTEREIWHTYVAVEYTH